MSVLGFLSAGGKLKKAKKLTVAARKEEGEKADQLFKQAYENFAAISHSHSVYPDALASWGFALYHQAQTKPADEAVKIFEEAIAKLSTCLTIEPRHLGAAIDGAVAMMGLARIKGVGLDDELYVKARELFNKAEEIQEGPASYNLACLFALQGDGDACLEKLEKARDFAYLPDEQDILNDDDLNNVKQMAWFDEFIASLAEEEEVKEEDEDDDEEIDEDGEESEK